MSEYILQLIAFLKIISVAGFSYLYGLGGIYGKWKRRYVAPLILTVTISLFALWVGRFTWWILTYYPLLVAALHLGYGGNTLWEKIKKRSIYGFAVSVAAFPLAIIGNAWLLYVLHIFLNVTISIVLGAFNPCKDARSEETLIGVTISTLPLFMI